MKKGFTLIELLITVTVMVTLMAITFRISNVSAVEGQRVQTAITLQKVENCLSGYYAAFGSYPPVPLHGTRDIYRKIDPRTGMQGDESGSTLDWDQVEAVCRSQPVGCSFPMSPGMQDTVSMLAQELTLRKEQWGINLDVTKLAGGLKTPSPGEFTDVWDEHEWREVQLFKFGLMSFLLPRYLVMTKSDRRFFGDGGMGVPKQWSVNNNEPIDATTGARVDSSSSRAWTKILDYVEVSTTGDNAGKPMNMSQYMKVANMPTQAICARWISNLTGLCKGWQSYYIFGTYITGSTAYTEKTAYNPIFNDFLKVPKLLEVYTTNSGHSYTLDFVKVCDAYDWENYQGEVFNNELYYYSPVGYQSYILWSGGRNHRTFPPWMSIADFSESDKKIIREWTQDDIIRMKN